MSVYLALGSNMGDREKYILAAINSITANRKIELLRQTDIIETVALGNKKNQNDFLNAIIEIDTELNPIELLQVCLDVEEILGRVRKEKWGDRTIDIDILLYDNYIVDMPILTIPHPEMHKRKFILQLLGSLAPNLVHPIINKKISTLLENMEIANALHR